MCPLFFWQNNELFCVIRGWLLWTLLKMHPVKWPIVNSRCNPSRIVDEINPDFIVGPMTASRQHIEGSLCWRVCIVLWFFQLRCESWTTFPKRLRFQIVVNSRFVPCTRWSCRPVNPKGNCFPNIYWKDWCWAEAPGSLGLMWVYVKTKISLLGKWAKGEGEARGWDGLDKVTDSADMNLSNLWADAVVRKSLLWHCLVTQTISMSGVLGREVAEGKAKGEGESRPREDRDSRCAVSNWPHLYSLCRQF